MSLSAKQIKQLEKIIDGANQLLKQAKVGGNGAGKVAAPRKRRSGKELVAFRKMLKDEFASGKSVIDIAKEHGISSAYIYQLPGLKRAKTAGKKATQVKTAPKKAAAKKSVARKSAVKKSAAKTTPVQKSAEPSDI